MLGQRTWFLLHTIAAKYPDLPNKVDELAVKHLIATLGQHYPCPMCRRHLQQKLANPALGPVPTKSRTDLALWLCDLHNMVNTDLGKKLHHCNSLELDLQYLKSCGECSVKQSIEDSPIQEDGEPSWDYHAYLRQLGAEGREETHDGGDTGLSPRLQTLGTFATPRRPHEL